MESKIRKPKEAKYPKLMIRESSGTVVLMVSERNGCIVHGRDEYVGAFSSNWDMSGFVDFNGTVELSN